VSELNRTIGSYPGSVRTRFSDRKPQTHAYALVSFMQTLTDGFMPVNRQ
jgi:hypothetical protein